MTLPEVILAILSFIVLPTCMMVYTIIMFVVAFFIFLIPREEFKKSELIIALGLLLASIIVTVFTLNNSDNGMGPWYPGTRLF